MEIRFIKSAYWSGFSKSFPTLRFSQIVSISIFLSIFAFNPAFSQGSIFGSVTNSDASTPANGEIGFFGFLDDTDEEIRIESCIGAGYDSGFWYDDFQNYLTEAPGNPYDYHFFNPTNGEGYILSDIIPNNSFQQEDIVLASNVWPDVPSGMNGQTISSGKALIYWDATPGLTHHIYRRSSISDGSFFRRDDTTGSLSNSGISSGYFIDTLIGNSDSVDYLIIAEDASGNLSPHSEVIDIITIIAEAPKISSVWPASGPVTGGFAIEISGIGFDDAGVAVTIGGAALTSVTVNNPFWISGFAPPGVTGPVNIILTNTVSGLADTLSEGFTYLANQPPVLDSIGYWSVPEGDSLFISISASDPEGFIPVLSASVLPPNANLTDNNDGTGKFSFYPDYGQAGDHSVTFYANDGIDLDSESVIITVLNVNRAPVIDSIGPFSVVEYSSLNFTVTASDPDGTFPELTASDVPSNSAFIDYGNGSGSFTFEPVIGQAGEYNLIFAATDEPDEGPDALVDTITVNVTVTADNPPPQLAWPIDNEVLQDHSPTLDWSDVVGADEYRVEVDNSPGFTSAEWRMTTTTSEKTISPDLPIGTWYWRVRAHYASGWSDWSAVAAFRICDMPNTPTLVRPVNGSDGVARPVNFDWSDIGGASSYQLTVRASSTIVDTLLDVSSFNLPNLDENTTYYWQVRALSNCNLWSPWSGEWSFTTECPTPNAPLLAEPHNGDTVTRVTIIWNESPGATGYQLMVDDDAGFASPVIDIEQAEMTYNAIDLADTTEYFWRVRAENHCGWGAWSPGWSFKTSEPTDVVDTESPNLPNRLALKQNYPNPFNPVTTIEFSLPRTGFVTLDVFDIVGRRVTILVSSQLSAGEKKIVWNGINDNGREVASGIYFYRLRMDDMVITRKMILTK